MNPSLCIIVFVEFAEFIKRRLCRRKGAAWSHMTFLTTIASVIKRAEHNFGSFPVSLVENRLPGRYIIEHLVTILSCLQPIRHMSFAVPCY